ncbi:hypothetical protein BCR33DRAFT_716912, partial [Rhizoclosmatium globosum]
SKKGLSQLGKTPDGYSEVYLKLSIPNAGLNDISDLEPYKYIQNLNLSGNELTDISCLGSMLYLVKLDVSNNKLTEVLDYWPTPFNLQEIDFSRNQIMEIADLSEHRFLKTIKLDRNLIKDITGLSECRFLTYLSLSFNGIRNICNLDNLPIKYLDLRSNRLVSLEGIETLSSLEDLHLSNNAIHRLTSINSNHKYLRHLDLDCNQIDDPEQITHLKSTLRMLTELSFKRNPIVMPLPTPIPGVTPPTLSTLETSTSTYLSSTNSLNSSTNTSTRKSAIYHTHTHNQRVRPPSSGPVPPSPQTVVANNQEKVAAVNAYNPSPSVIASLQHSCLLKRQAKLYAKVKAEDLMRATYLRPIVLCGPSGAGKRTLTNRLLKDFPHIYGCSVSHTTRKPRIGEEQGTHYHFVSRAEMEAMVEEGKFAEVVTLFGCMYGTSMEAIDKVTEEGKVCIMDLEIEGVLALKRSHLKPLYIFITVPSLEVLKNRLENRLRPATAANHLRMHNHVRPNHMKIVETIQEHSTSHSPSHSRPASSGLERPVSGIMGDLDSSISRPVSGLPPDNFNTPGGEKSRPSSSDSVATNASGINDDDDEIRKLILQKGNGNYSLMNLVTGVGLPIPPQQAPQPAQPAQPQTQPLQNHHQTLAKPAVSVAPPSTNGEATPSSDTLQPIQPTGHAPLSEEQFQEDVEKWMAKAPGVESYEKMKDFFDLRIVNDDPERAYAELRDFCLSTYIKCFNESE